VLGSILLTVRTHMRRFFARISLLWAFAHLDNAAVTLWLPNELAPGDLRRRQDHRLAAVTAIAISVHWFRVSMRGQGDRVQFGARSRSPTPADWAFARPYGP
jgi:hypothetical protein